MFRQGMMTNIFGKDRLQLYFWTALGFVAFGVLIDVAGGEGEYAARVVNNFWRVLFLLVINFFFLERTLPFIRLRKHLLVKIPLYLLAFWIQLMLYAFGAYAWRVLGIHVHVYTALKTFETPMEGVTYGFPFAFFSLFAFGIMRHLYDHNKLKNAAQQLMIEKQQAELNYLKSQTNPHFLFNTLNNIYSLAKDKSDLAPESILRLSKILRYMLYEAGGEFVAIEQELKILENYIALETLRYDNSVLITFSHDVESLRQAVPPLLLMPLVENAFKHGMAETRHNPFVTIHLSIRNRRLEFIVRNSIEPAPAEPPVRDRIGLANLRRQLDLLYREFDLSVSKSESVCTTTLTINLATHVNDNLHHRGR